MPRIELLDKSIADKIAAGEVVERPSSVIKELVENAIDAKATAITVEIKDGGTKLIRITDNGCGIEADQIPIAFLRHSTSKIRSVEDLIRISSLGFRGEALSSISAVARVGLITKTKEAFTGTRYIIEGGQTMNPSVDDLLSAISKINAKHVFIFPNNGNVIFKMNSLTQKLGNMDYVPPAYLASDLTDVKPEEWMTLYTKTQKNYAEIFADF